MQYIASPSFLVLILSVHFPRIRGIAQHALDLVQDTDINELYWLAAIKLFMQVYSFYFGARKHGLSHMLV